MDGLALCLRALLLVILLLLIACVSCLFLGSLLLKKFKIPRRKRQICFLVQSFNKEVEE